MIAIEIYINSNNFAIFNEVFRWIKDQQQLIKLQFKLDIYCEDINHEHLTDFLNSSHIVELNISNLSQALSLNYTLYQSLRCLEIDDDKFIDLSKFTSL